MQQLNLKPTHKAVRSYYEALGQFGRLDIGHEGAVRGAFHNLLAGQGPHTFAVVANVWEIRTLRTTDGRACTRLDSPTQPKADWVGHSAARLSQTTGVISESPRFEIACPSVPHIERELGWPRLGPQSTAFLAQPCRP